MRTLIKIRPIKFPGAKRQWTWECAVCMHMPEFVYLTWEDAKNAGLGHVAEYESRYRR